MKSDLGPEETPNPISVIRSHISREEVVRFEGKPPAEINAGDYIKFIRESGMAEDVKLYFLSQSLNRPIALCERGEEGDFVVPRVFNHPDNTNARAEPLYIYHYIGPDRKTGEVTRQYGVLMWPQPDNQGD